jgi:hypothetical protein
MVASNFTLSSSLCFGGGKVVQLTGKGWCRKRGLVVQSYKVGPGGVPLLEPRHLNL